MSNDDFAEKAVFNDPLTQKSSIKYSNKFTQGSIYNPSFIEKENEISRKKITIVFDLDDTIRGWNEYTNQGFLRKSLKKVLGDLRDIGFRLIIWSAANRKSIQQTLNKYPEFENYFDRIISAENYCLQFVSDDDKKNLQKVNRKYYNLILSESKGGIDPKTGKSISRPAKDISMFGYKLLIENEPVSLEEAKNFCYNCILVFPYKYEDPGGDMKLDRELIEFIEKDFRDHMVQRVINSIESPAPYIFNLAEEIIRLTS